MAASRKLHRPWLYPPLTSEAYRAYLDRLDARKVGFLARRSEDGAIVGWLNVSEIVRLGFQTPTSATAASRASRGRAT